MSKRIIKENALSPEADKKAEVVVAADENALSPEADKKGKRVYQVEKDIFKLINDLKIISVHFDIKEQEVFEETITVLKNISDTVISEYLAY